MSSGSSTDVNLGETVSFSLDITITGSGTSTHTGYAVFQVFLSLDSAGTSPLFTETGTTTMQGIDLTTVSPVTVTDISAEIDLSSETTCTFAYVCVDMNPVQGTWVLDAAASNNVGCTSVNCILPPVTISSVTVTSDSLSFSVGETKTLTLNVTLSCSSGEVTGTDLYLINVYMATDDVGSNPSTKEEATIVNNDQTLSVTTDAELTGVLVTLTTDCTSFSHVCVDVGPSASATWQLDAGGTGCVAIATCIDPVLISQVSVTLDSSDVTIQLGASNIVTVDITLTSSSGDDITGVDLYKAMGYLASGVSGDNPQPPNKVEGTIPDNSVTLTSSTSATLSGIVFDFNFNGLSSCDVDESNIYDNICVDVSPSDSASWMLRSNSNNMGCVTVTCQGVVTTVGTVVVFQTTLSVAVPLVVQEFSIMYDQNKIDVVHSDVVLTIMVDVTIASSPISNGIHGDKNWKIDIFAAETETGLNATESLPVTLNSEEISYDLNPGENVIFEDVTVTLPLTSCVGTVYACVKVEPHVEADWTLDIENAVNIKCEPIECSPAGAPTTHNITTQLVSAAETTEKSVPATITTYVVLPDSSDTVSTQILTSQSLFTTDVTVTDTVIRSTSNQKPTTGLSTATGFSTATEFSTENLPSVSYGTTSAATSTQRQHQQDDASFSHRSISYSTGGCEDAGDLCSLDRYCLNDVSGYTCECKPSYYDINGTCTDADTYICDLRILEIAGDTATYLEELNNPTSSLFKHTSTQIENAMDAVFHNSSDYYGLDVLGFSSGSIRARFVLYFSSTSSTTMEDVKTKLQSEVKNGNGMVGGLTIDIDATIVEDYNDTACDNRHGNDCSDNADCIDLANGDFTCDCLEGYDDVSTARLSRPGRQCDLITEHTVYFLALAVSMGTTAGMIFVCITAFLIYLKKAREFNDSIKWSRLRQEHPKINSSIAINPAFIPDTGIEIHKINGPIRKWSDSYKDSRLQNQRTSYPEDTKLDRLVNEQPVVAVNNNQVTPRSFGKPKVPPKPSRKPPNFTSRPLTMQNPIPLGSTRDPKKIPFHQVRHSNKMPSLAEGFTLPHIHIVRHHRTASMPNQTTASLPSKTQEGAHTGHREGDVFRIPRARFFSLDASHI
uniref:Mucin-22-like n=1 Tax=Saccoglossus kowalevskii TaxID=10224 RepID=A0ABM0M5G7_SACKO|nr:PREDICTED: mucin-22-like [Saccoglossus kowalevskii]